MGIDNNSLRFLAECTAGGVSLAWTATLGRQNFYRVTPESLVAGLARVGHSMTRDHAFSVMTSDGVYADELLRYLGARVLESFDYSDYEGATHVVDMNRPVDARFHGRYTTVLDGGSLEHIFNFPQAIANCMQMVAAGGHFITFCPANNFFGHGFYQFSPELFFRIFSPENGFETERMVLVEDDQGGGGCFEVVDPAIAGERVILTSATPCHLFVQARKVKDVEPFATPPYQSDYVTMWQGESNAQAGVPPRASLAVRVRNVVKALVPQGGKEWLRRRLFPGPRSRPDHFRRIP